MDAGRISRLLPEVYQAANQPGSVLDAVLAVMETLHAPAEAALADLDRVFDPRRGEDAYVRMLAAWVGLGRLLHAPGGSAEDRRQRMMIEPGNLRELTARAAELSRTRGTAGALRSFLELATGVTGFEIDESPSDENGRPIPFAATLTVPAAAAASRDLIKTIVAREKPAFTLVTTVYKPA